MLHPLHGEGEIFKFVGCLFDVQLLMTQAVEKILSQIRPKMQAILRTQAHYPVKDLVGQFKTHVWGLMEYHHGAIFHATDYLVNKLDAAQHSFLHKLGIEDEVVFLQFNFVPSSLRRDEHARHPTTSTAPL